MDYGADGPATLGKVNATVDATRKGKEKERWEWKFATADKDDQGRPRLDAERCSGHNIKNTSLL